LRLTLVVSSAVSSAATAGLLVLLRLAAVFAAFRSRIATLLEKRLIFAREREFLSTITTGQLLIVTHKALSYYSFAARPIAGTPLADHVFVLVLAATIRIEHRVKADGTTKRHHTRIAIARNWNYGRILEGLPRINFAFGVA
jgi:hypothetical protein